MIRLKVQEHRCHDLRTRVPSSRDDVKAPLRFKKPTIPRNSFDFAISAEFPAVSPGFELRDSAGFALMKSVVAEIVWPSVVGLGWQRI